MKLKQPEIKGFKTSDNKTATPTPMMRQYLGVKERHKNYLLFYRMGDFYELFFEDAKIASAALGIALTRRGKLNNEDIPMCGVPVHSSQTYLSRLINQGHKVAIAEQLGDDQSENSKKYHKLFKRDVVKIITPGTILDDSLLESKSDNHLLSLSVIKGDISISWIDMTLGFIKLQEINESDVLNELYESIIRVEPQEIILSDNLEKIKFLDSRFDLFKKKISCVPNSFFDSYNNAIKVKKFFKNHSVVPPKNLTQSNFSAVGAIINYLELTQKKNIPQINNLELINKKNFLQIDDFSARSLELFERIDGQKQGSLLSVIDKTKTAAGGRLLKNFIKAPLVNSTDIKKRHNLVEEFLNDPLIIKRIIDCLTGQPDAERALSRISGKINNPRDLILIKNFIENSENVFFEVDSLNKKVVSQLLPNQGARKIIKELKNLITKNIIDNPPINLKEGGIFKKDISKNLDYLRNIKSVKQGQILEMQKRYSLITTVQNLKIRFNNIHGYFIEVTNKYAQKVKDTNELKFDLIQNTINNSRFQTKELREASNEIERANEESINLEKKLYDEICQKLDSLSFEIHAISKKIALIDVITNFANLSLTRNYSKPKLSDKILIEISKGRHPVVEESLLINSEEFTPNNCKMDSENFAWLMTGPNMAGKSTFLRQTAIIIILNQIGCFVPAESAQLGIFDKIFTRIGASDNLSKGMSTFMTEMIETSKIINEASIKSLVILDELGRGTSTEDGLAIAQSVLEYILNEKKCITLFATHYKQLAKLSEHYNALRLKTLSIKKWNDEIIFLYKIIDGVSEGSFGIHVANMAGLKKSIIIRSKKILEQIIKNKQQKNISVKNEVFKVNEDNNERKMKDIKNTFERINLDELSPKEALDILYIMKKNFE